MSKKNSTKLQPLKPALAVGNCRWSQRFFHICCGNCFYLICRLIYFFFQAKLFQNFVKLLTKFTPYLHRCSFRPQNTSEENITPKNPMQLLFSFSMEPLQVFPFIPFSEKPLYFLFLQKIRVWFYCMIESCFRKKVNQMFYFHDIQR